MIEHKNTILAIVLSLIVVVGWNFFIAKPQMERQQREAQLKQQEQAQLQKPQAQSGSTPLAPQAGTPSVPGSQASVAQPSAPDRAAIVAASPRVSIQTPTLSGSIDLKGARIDNLSLEQYRETVNPSSPAIVLFSPSGAPDAYYAEFGFVPAAGVTEKMQIGRAHV